MNIYCVYVAFAISLGLFIMFAILSYRRKNQIGRSLGRAIKCSYWIVISYIVLFVANNARVTDIAISVIKILVIWDLFFCTRFVQAYTKTPDNKAVKCSMIGILILDSLLFVTNSVNNMMMSAKMTIDNNCVYLSVTPHFFYPFHLTIVLLMCSYCILILAKKAKSCSYVVRFRYTILVHVSILLLLLETWFIFAPNSQMDYTVFLYVFAIAFSYYFAFAYVPRRLYKAIFDVVDNNNSDAIIIFDDKGGLIRINEAAKERFPSEMLADEEKIIEFVGASSAGERRIEHEDKIYVSYIHYLRDRKGKVIAVVFIFRDITEKEKIQEHRHRVATTDHLTGALNRGGFFEKALLSIKEHPADEEYTLLIGGIADFKEINSTYGTRVGDEVLLEITRKLETFSQTIPMIYGRTAEGKFACLIKSEHIDDVKLVFSSYELTVHAGVTLTANFNFGVIVMDDPDKSLDYYYERALLALSEAKRDSNRNFVEYTQEMEDAATKKYILTSEMNRSLEAGDFYPVFQPQIDLRTNEIVGAEALVRWNHPSYGMISPGDFIPLFEANGFISKLDEYIWNKVAEIAVELKEKEIFDGAVSVNVSQVDITTIDLAETFEEIVERTGIERERLHIEITESACANNRDRLISTIEKLRAKGFKLEIDDFGSGYSSLNALQNLPFDIIKLDMEFVRKDDFTARDEIIVNSIAQMIHKMGGRIIVEGIETIGQYERSVNLGGDIGQGYHFARPLSKEDFCTFVKEYKAL